jgi:hypothetical protein
MTYLSCMKKIFSLTFLTVCIFFFGSIVAMADFNSGLDATAITVQYIMADPPLPSKDHKKNSHSIKGKPGFVTGKTEAHYDYGGGTYSDQSGSVKGPTIGASYTFGVKEKLSSFAWLVGTSLKGDFETKQNGEATPSIYSTNVEAEVINISLGMSYEIFNKQEKGYGLSFFFGPYMPIYRYKQHYQNTSQTFEADLEGNETFVGLLIGAQWDIDVGENWGFQPFALFGDTFGSKDFFNPFGDSGECRPYKVSNVTAGNINTAQIGEIDCQNKQEFLYDTQIGGLGLNLSYKPWNISTNLFTPLLNQLIFKLFYEGEKPKLMYFSFTWSFSG